MKDKPRNQIVISGVGGQGVLFVTRLLAEAAIAKGLPVFTSETHGMAQRGGTVISHLKVGEFSSPLINPGQADGLIALKAENLSQHGGYLKKNGWATVNSPAPMEAAATGRLFFLDADRLARQMDDPKTLNLLMLGFTLRRISETNFVKGWLHCDVDDVAAVLKTRLKGKVQLLQNAIRALEAGASAVAGTA
ncbi:indolepyruvate oxidoreductase [Desulfosarcina widdelii]|uniref:Indolepyruvate oxidoreductase n=1 Tax=Desulfosarcina widdelii TaxID=947919 RepID=A0A5K7Z939_9BACT|nr:2-oxoacid:acceptor oxidoreductase family protein [Desulfosarcina widdelii]BBO77290.1 indolepyruvate oxidoreductase [Desulfosarcina widdelii]